MSDKLKLRITRCYLVEVVDKDGYVQRFNRYGCEEEANDFCFGTKEDAKKVGQRLIEWVEESRNE